MVRTGWRRFVELVVHRGQCRQSEHSLDELEDRGVVVKRGLEVAWLGEWRDHPGWNADAQTPRIQLRRWLVGEETACLVIRKGIGAVFPRPRHFQGRDHLALES